MKSMVDHLSLNFIRQNKIKILRQNLFLTAFKTVRKEDSLCSSAEPFFQPGDSFIQERCHQTEQKNGEHYPIHFKELRQFLR